MKWSLPCIINECPLTVYFSWYFGELHIKEIYHYTDHPHTSHLALHDLRTQKKCQLSPLTKIDSSRESIFCKHGIKFSYKKNAVIIDISITDVSRDLVRLVVVGTKCWLFAGLLEVTDEVSRASRSAKVAPYGVNPTAPQTSPLIHRLRPLPVPDSIVIITSNT